MVSILGVVPLGPSNDLQPPRDGFPQIIYKGNRNRGPCSLEPFPKLILCSKCLPYQLPGNHGPSILNNVEIRAVRGPVRKEAHPLLCQEALGGPGHMRWGIVLLKVDPAPRGTGARNKGQGWGQNMLLIPSTVQCTRHSQQQGRPVLLQRQPNHYATFGLDQLAGIVGVKALALPPPHRHGFVAPNEESLLV